MGQRRYDKSDVQLQESVQQVLARSPYFAGRNLTIEVDDEDVVLSGVVETYYQKQLAQESIRLVEGVKQIRNEIEVVAPHWSNQLSPAFDVEQNFENV